MKLTTLMLSAILGLATAAACADTQGAGGNAGTAAPKTGYCQSHQQDCVQQAQQFDGWCAANADKCIALKAHIEKRREWCEQNQDKCQALRAKIRARMQERCQANPDAPRCQTGAAPAGDQSDDGASS